MSVSAGCEHTRSQFKSILDRLKVLVPYSTVCSKRQTLLVGRRGAQTSSYGLASGTAIAQAAGGNEENSNGEEGGGQSLATATGLGAAAGGGTSTSGGGGANSGNLEGDRSRKRLVEEMPSPLCEDCGTTMDRLHSCLECEYFGCWRLKSHSLNTHESNPGINTSHIVQHLNKTGHCFAIDFYRLQIYCRECRDYVYDPSIANWLRGMTARWYAALCDAAEPEAKRPRMIGVNVEITPAEAKFAKEHGSIRPCGGLRGLRNLGATCYLNVIVQALFQNPLVRSWFLSGGHSTARCKVGRKKAKGHGDGANAKGYSEKDSGTGKDRSSDRHCIACELYNLILRFYNGDTTPIGPSELLYSLWMLRPDLSGYGQQDAHECFMAILDQLHDCLADSLFDIKDEDTEKLFNENLSLSEMVNNVINKNKGGFDLLRGKDKSTSCNCIVHQTFGGTLQSTVICQSCKNVTVANDPVLDFSLDIQQSAHRIFSSDSGTGSKHSFDDIDIKIKKKMVAVDWALRKKAGLAENGMGNASEGFLGQKSETGTSGSRNANGNGNRNGNTNGLENGYGGTNGMAAHVLSLQECLEQFTSPEVLGPGTYVCSNCKAANGRATKQLSIKQLPPVLAFQFKRFNVGTNSSSKLNTYVKLPLALDMTPYTTGSLNPHVGGPGGSLSSISGTPLSTLFLLNSCGTSGNYDGGAGEAAANEGPSATTINSNLPLSAIATMNSASGSRRRTEPTRVNPACKYELFAVVNHTGALDTGHYTIFCQHRNMWFKFDDSSVTLADISDVLGLDEEHKAQRGEAAKGLAYMAFYVKNTLDFDDLQNSSSLDSYPAGASDFDSKPLSLSSKQMFNKYGKKVERRGRKKASQAGLDATASPLSIDLDLHDDDDNIRASPHPHTYRKNSAASHTSSTADKPKRRGRPPVSLSTNNKASGSVSGSTAANAPLFGADIGTGARDFFSKNSTLSPNPKLPVFFDELGDDSMPDDFAGEDGEILGDSAAPANFHSPTTGKGYDDFSDSDS